ncbi:MAG TPA: HAD family phosphatase [Bryobacteraceae bacterium]|jgi:beta-phosphoglucomutase
MKTAELSLARGLALIFDLDGVVVDSMPAHTLAWQRYLERLGIPGEDVSTRMHGRRNDEIVRDFLGPCVPGDVVFEHGAAKERLFREMMAPHLMERLVPGVDDFLARASSPPAPAPVALATNAEPANVNFVLQGTGLGRWFPVVANGTHVKNAKPAPDIYLYAAKELNIEPRNCIVFEDSPVGIAAARAAGMRVAGIQTHSEALEFVDVAVRDFRDPELERWLATQQAS